MQHTYRISASYPVPNGSGEVRNKYPWKTLKVGESFLVKDAPKRLLNQCYVRSKALAPKKFVCHKVKNGAVRVWRAI